MKIKLGS